MTEERQNVIVEDATAPRWVGIVVVALAVVSLVALGAGWTASTRSKQLEQDLATQEKLNRQNNDVLTQRLTKAEDTTWQYSLAFPEILELPFDSLGVAFPG